MNPIEEYQQLSVLVVEDEEMEWTLLQHSLKSGWKSSLSLIRVTNVADAKEYLQKIKFNLILLDLNVPDSSGIQTVHQIVAENHHKAAIVVTTSLSDQAIAIAALRAGAQDYLVKGQYLPGDLAQAILHSLARTENLRTRSLNTEIPEIEFLKIDLIRQVLILSDKTPTLELALTPTEVKLMSAFVKKFDAEISRQDLVVAAIGAETHIAERTLDNQISRLRAKIKSSPYEIQSIRGLGYRLKKKEA